MMTMERPEDQRARQTSGAVAGIQVAQLPAHHRADLAAVAPRGDATQWPRYRSRCREAVLEQGTTFPTFRLL